MPTTPGAPARAASRCATAATPSLLKPKRLMMPSSGIEPEQPRPRIARLRLRRDAARLDEPEAEPQQRVDHLGMLVEAGRQADRIGEGQAKRRDAQLFVVGCRTRQRRMLERTEREPVRRLGIEPAQQRPSEMVEQPNHASSGNTWRPSAPSGSGFTQRTAESGRLA